MVKRWQITGTLQKQIEKLKDTLVIVILLLFILFHGISCSNDLLDMYVYSFAHAHVAAMH